MKGFGVTVVISKKMTGTFQSGNRLMKKGMSYDWGRIGIALHTVGNATNG